MRNVLAGGIAVATVVLVVMFATAWIGADDTSHPVEPSGGPTHTPASGSVSAPAADSDTRPDPTGDCPLPTDPPAEAFVDYCAID